MNTVVLSGIYFSLRCQGKINISTNDHSACTKSYHFEWHVKNIGKPYPNPAHTLSFPDLGPSNVETWSTPLHKRLCSGATVADFRRLRNDLYCVEWGVKLYSLTHSHWL